MHPLITNATPIISFGISGHHRARLLGEIKAPGIVQYHSILVLYGAGEDPVRFYCSEWNRMDPETVAKPVFGIFSDGGHSNLGTSHNWRDPHLFLMHAVELVVSDLQIETPSLCEGEAWAVSGIMKTLNQAASAKEPLPLEAEYWKAIRRNDSRIAAYMKANTRI